MKTITKRELNLITDTINEGLTSLAEAVLEKDLLLVDALRSIDSIDQDGIRLVFCGGTCLAKAHGLIHRMSEDIDFKLIVPEGLARSARSRALSRFKTRVVRHFEQLGFVVPADQIVALSENSYISMNLHYASRFPSVASLRSEIKIELNARPPILPTAPRSIRSLLSSLLNDSGADFSIECIGIEETLAEKILSFLRRTAEMRAGRHRGKYDERLIRHLYDANAIMRVLDDLEIPALHFARMVIADGLQYQRQYPEFMQDPVAEMTAVLHALQDDGKVFERAYFEFLDELVFGEAVSFAEARNVFTHAAEVLIASIPRDIKAT